MMKNIAGNVGPSLGQRRRFVPSAGCASIHRLARFSGTAPNGKNKLAAALFAIFLGGFGIHKFYLGRIGWGLVYLCLCWTFSPSLLGFIEGIIYLTMSDESFVRKYGQL